MQEDISSAVETLYLSNELGQFEIEPLANGFGLTVGNALRRVLLSSLTGAAITAIRVENVYHEFSTVPGVREDTTELILNLSRFGCARTQKRPSMCGWRAPVPAS